MEQGIGHLPSSILHFHRMAAFHQPAPSALGFGECLGRSGPAVLVERTCAGGQPAIGRRCPLATPADACLRLGLAGESGRQLDLARRRITFVGTLGLWQRLVFRRCWWSVVQS